MAFLDLLKENSSWTTTENGMEARETTGDPVLDLFSTIGALRTRPSNEITALFDKAFYKNPLYAVRTAFYARDIRGGLGERRTFRIIIQYMAKFHKAELAKNLHLIPEYGRWDDLYALVGTDLEKEMWDLMRGQLDSDLEAVRKYNSAVNSKTSSKKKNIKVPSISLLAKWLKSANATNNETRILGNRSAENLFSGSACPGKEYRKSLSLLRSHLKVVESLMSKREWDKIEYSAVPSLAMKKYRKAFSKHDLERFGQYITAVKAALSNGENIVVPEGMRAKINAGTLYPYDIVRNVLINGESNDVLECQWKSLPNYVKGNHNILVMADVSGSMTCDNCTPLASSIGLALYFAESNTGPFHNHFMTFSSRPAMIEIVGDSLYQKVDSIHKSSWGMSTNIEAAFEVILDTAIENKISQDEMPSSLIIISDMEFDNCVTTSKGKRCDFYTHMSSRYANAGYKLPNIVFWNVCSRQNVFHTKANSNGAWLVSGHSVSVFKHLLEFLGNESVDLVSPVLESERYQAITV